MKISGFIANYETYYVKWLYLRVVEMYTSFKKTQLQCMHAGVGAGRWL